MGSESGYHAAVLRIALTAALALAFAGSASASFSDPTLAKSLKTQMVKTFKKQAPALKITTVTCTAPTSGVTAKCTAHFTDGSIKGYYPVKATIHDNGKMTWVAQSPKCLNAKTGKYGAC
jgi:hypothetical protein